MKIFKDVKKLIETIIIGVLFLTGFILTTVLLSLKFSENSYYAGYSAFSETFVGPYVVKNLLPFYGSIITVILYFVGLAATIGGVLLYIFKKKKIIFQVSIILYLLSCVLVIAFYSSDITYTDSMLIFSIVSIVFLLLSFTASCFFLKLSESEKEASKKKKEEEVYPEKKVLHLNKWFTLVLNVLGLASFFLPIVTPFLMSETGETYLWFIEMEGKESLLGFVISISIFVFAAIFYAQSIAYFVNAPRTFFRRTKVLNFMGLIYNFLLFVVSIILIYINDLNLFSGFNRLVTYTYIPFAIAAVLYVLISVIDEKMDDYVDKLEDKRYYKKSYITFAIPFAFITLLTLITFLTLVVQFVDVSLKYGTVSIEKSLTGLELITTYRDLDKGFQFVALLEIIILMCSGVAFLVCLCAFVAKNKEYGTIIKISAFANVFLIFMCGISSLYFKIGTKINLDNISSLLTSSGVSTGGIDLSNYDIDIKTQTLYLCIGELVVLAIMIVSRQMKSNEDFVKAEKLEVEATLLNSLPRQAEPAQSAVQPEQMPSPQPVESEENKEIEEVKKPEPIKEEPNQIEKTEPAIEENSAPVEEKPKIADYNMCPSFLELDLKINDDKEKILKKKENPLNIDSLSSLCDYIVEYARNSRLHLSYTKQDIATFISGLGASKLTILQGMSGTGKTSLPKIFAEAISSNVDIIEIESSWRDKNELLGHFNEFTQKFTPKKFTEALYNAKINDEVITFIVLDELNLSRIEYYFSDFLSLMENEKDKRYIKLTNVPIDYVENGEHKKFEMLEDGESLKISDNIWFIGTANMDESTFAISDKVYDRAQTMTFSKRAKKVVNFGEEMTPKFLSYESFENLLDGALNRDYSINLEDNETVKAVENLLKPYNISFGNRILNQMESFIKIYTSCINSYDSFNEALEAILLSKVVRKLETKTIEDKESLIEEFDKLGLRKCKEFLVSLNAE